RAMDARARRAARCRDGERQWRARRGHPNRGGRLSVDAAQGRLPYTMPVAASVPDAPRRLPWGCIWVSAAGAAPRGLLRRLLLDADGTFVCGRRYERALDRAPRVAHSFGEA